jgi:hypothetical protein
MSDSNIYEKLRRVQLELRAPKIEHGRFGAHRSAEGILQAVKPVLDKHGLTLLLGDELVNVGERNYVKATAIVAYGQASIEATAFAWEGEVSRGLDASQVTGMASSYARKYALGGLFAIDDTKDADSHENGSTASAAAPNATRPAVGTSTPADKPATPDQKRKMKNLLELKGVSVADMLPYLEEQYGIVPGSVMTSIDADNILKELQP